MREMGIGGADTIVRFPTAKGLLPRHSYTSHIWLSLKRVSRIFLFALDILLWHESQVTHITGLSIAPP